MPELALLALAAAEPAAAELEVADLEVAALAEFDARTQKPSETTTRGSVVVCVLS
jgi:hypothetical protein